MRGRIFDWSFLGLGLICQTVAYLATDNPPIVFFAGIFGIISVFLCAQGKLAMFVFGILNVLTYMWVSYTHQLYGEVAINLFFLCCQMYGIWNWRRHYHRDEKTGDGHLATRVLSWTAWLILLALALAGSLVVGFYFGHYTDDSDPYFDSFTTVPAYLAEVLMICGFREHWYLWFVIDIGCIIMWLRAGNWPMAVLKSFWCVNCIYGYVKWTAALKDASDRPNS